MGQNINAAVTRDVTIKPKMEEFVSRMALRRSSAASRDVPTKPKRVEFVLRMALK